jgi:pyroglutamyl-peptidase
MNDLRLLVTGFEPFDGEQVNVSWLVASALAGRRIGRARVRAACLPTVFNASLKALEEALRASEPVLVLALGQAAGRGELSLERVAINLNDARIPDNQGQQPIDTPVVRRGPAAYFTTLPVKAMAAAVCKAGLPAGLSCSAGTFVCNHVFYGLQQRLRRSGVRSGFMHLPLLPEQAPRYPGLPVMSLEDQIRGTQIALRAAMRVGDAADARLPGGTIA